MSKRIKQKHYEVDISFNFKKESCFTSSWFSTHVGAVEYAENMKSKFKKCIISIVIRTVTDEVEDLLCNTNGRKSKESDLPSTESWNYKGINL